LIEDFVAGVLEDRERELFLKNYLSAPLQKRKLTITRALNNYAAKTALPTVKRPENWLRRMLEALRPRNRFAQIAWAVMVLVAIVGTLLVFQIWRSRTLETELRAELTRLNGPGSTLLEPGVSVERLQLAPLNLREAGSAPTLTIVPQTQIVQLGFAVPPGQYQSYRATLEDSKGNVILSVDYIGVRTVGNAETIFLQLPPRIFRNDDYTLTLSGVKVDGRPEEVGDYSLRVIVKA
jgi:hypothetical protein